MKKRNPCREPLTPRRTPKLLLMKLTIAIGLSVCLNVAMASGYSQDAKISLSLKESSISKVLKAIQKKTHYKFVYANNVLDASPNVSVDVIEKPVADVLNTLFEHTGLTFKRVDEDMIIITPLEAEMAPQTRKITGKVTNENGEPLAGVTVQGKGTSTITATANDGTFSINLDDKVKTLLFSFVGMESQEIAVAGNNTVNVQMISTEKALGEVVVVGYGTLKKKTVVGSIASVKSEDLVKNTVPTLSGALVGRVPGLIARQSDARPGASTTIQIRNFGTPVYVIDGVPKDEGQFNNLDVNDVEDIQILKDGAAAGVYGIGSANGVVLVTTKRGKRNEKNKVDFRFYKSYKDWTRYPKVANAAQYYEAQVESDINRFGTTTRTKAELDKWAAGTEEGFRGFDWASFGITRWFPMINGNLSTSGGSDKINYYIGISHTNEDAAIKDFNFRRTNLQANVDASVSSSLKISTQINGRVERRQNPGLPGGDDLGNPLLGIFRNIPTLRPFANDNPNYPRNNGIYTQFNPALYTYDKTGYLDQTWRVLQTNLSADYTSPIKGLKARVTYNYYMANYLGDVQEFTYYSYDYDKATDKYIPVFSNPNPYKEKQNTLITESIVQAQVNYDRTFNKHNVSAVVGYEQQQRTEKGTFNRTSPTTDFITLLVLADSRDIVDTRTEAGKLGYFGRVNYSYAGKYSAEVSGRYDGNSAFNSFVKYKFFPTFAVGYRISDEPFFSPGLKKIVSDLKLRVSYAHLGDASGINAASYITGYNFGAGNSIFNGANSIGLTIRQTPSINLSWIDVISKNLALDFSLFNNKLSGTFEVFERERTGIPGVRAGVLLPAELGVGLPAENLNSELQRGFDFMLNHSGKIGQFRYSVGGNVTLSRRKQLSNLNIISTSQVDQYFGLINGRDNTNRFTDFTFGYVALGQFQSMKEIADWKVDQDGQGNRTLLPGDIKYQDLNGDGVITAYDQQPIGWGTGLPLTTFGLNVSASWKGFDFSMLAQGATQYRINLNGVLTQPFVGNGNIPTFLLDRWHRVDPFDKNSAWVPGKYPSIRQDGNASNNLNGNVSTFWNYNVNYLRIKSLEIGYTLPEKLTKKIGLQKLRVYANGYNLFTFDNIKIIDPEVNAGSGRQYPQQKILTFGVNVTL